MLGVILGALLLLLFLGLVFLQGAIEWFDFDLDKWIEGIFIKKKDAGEIKGKKQAKKPAKSAAKKKGLKR